MSALINTVARIEALIGRDDLNGLVWDLASRAVDAILEDGTKNHMGWNTACAIEAAAPHSRRTRRQVPCVLEP